MPCELSSDLYLGFRRNRYEVDQFHVDCLWKASAEKHVDGNELGNKNLGDFQHFRQRLQYGFQLYNRLVP
jgi:hypothetical protein